MLYVLKTIVESCFEILPHDVFLCFAGFFEQIYHAFAKKPDKLFWTSLKKVTFEFAGKRLEHLESREILCVHRPKSLNALNVQGYKILTEQIHCLCNNVTYRLSAATNQSTNDQTEQTLHFNTSQLVLNQDSTVC